MDDFIEELLHNGKELLIVSMPIWLVLAIGGLAAILYQFGVK